MFEVLFVFAYGMIAFLMPIAIVLTLAIVIHWGRYRDDGLIAYLIYPVLLIVGLTIFLSGRNLYLNSDMALMVLVKHPIVSVVSRCTSVIMLLIASERIFRRLILLKANVISVKPLLFAFCFYFVSNVVASAFFGAHTSFSHDYVYMLVVGVAALFATETDGDRTINNARNALLIFLVLSFCLIFFKPELVLSRGYHGYIPGLNYRYAGLSNHANALGPLIVVFLMCLWVKPYDSRWLNRLGWVLGLFSLLLTQSKTSWIAFFLCSMSIAYFGHREFLKQRLFDLKRPDLLIGILLLVMLASILLSLVVMFGSVGDKLNSYLMSRAGSDLISMTGRNQIWDVAIQEWKKYPIFGYGLTIWNDDFRAQIGLPAAHHAHNQFFQSLASAGLVGVVGLITYGVVLFRYTLKTAESSKGLSVALFVMIFIRSISEVPLAISSFGAEQMVHLLMLMVIVSNIAALRPAVKINSVRLPASLTPVGRFN
jgi:exopolysaccharide production protein ExoQ